jgi:glutathione S-transferase
VEKYAGAGGLKAFIRWVNRRWLKITAILAESGAILEYLQETYDSARRLKPSREDKLQYRFWLHYAEGSLMPLLLMKLVFASLGKPPVPFGMRTLGNALGKGYRSAWLNRQLDTHARFIETHLPASAGLPARAEHGRYSDELSAMALLARGGVDELPISDAWVQRVEQRPAWQKPLSAGPFTLPGE